MFNNPKKLLKKLNGKVQSMKFLYEEFRVYDFGSYALNRLTPSKGYSVKQNLNYGTHARHTFDLYTPNHPREDKPVIVFVHGGAWSHGDKKDYRFVGEAFVKEGFDVVVLNYQLAPENVFPTYVDDLSLALNYFDENQTALNIQFKNIVLMGHSAGAFNIMSALYSPVNYNLNCKPHIKATIGLAGPYHFDYKDDPLCADAFDQTVSYQQVMPYYFVESNNIKHYLFVAQNDKIVHLKNATDFDQKLKEMQNHSKIIVVPKTGHISMMGSVSSLFSHFFETKQSIMKALDEALTK
jgi:acetyl esterase/lipase